MEQHNKNRSNENDATKNVWDTVSECEEENAREEMPNCTKQNKYLAVVVAVVAAVVAATIERMQN